MISGRSDTASLKSQQECPPEVGFPTHKYSALDGCPSVNSKHLPCNYQNRGIAPSLKQKVMLPKKTFPLTNIVKEISLLSK